MGKRVRIGVLLAGVVATAALGVVGARALNHVDARSSVFGPIERLLIEGDSGTIEVVGSDRPDARIRESRRSIVGAPAATSAFVERGTLRVRGLCPGGLVLRCRTDFRVDVPATTRVEIVLGHGAIVARELSASLTVSALDADTRLERLRGTVSVTNRRGASRGEALSVRQIDVHSEAGSVSLAFSAPPDDVRVQTDDGDVQVVVPGVPFRVTTKTERGQTHVDACQHRAAPRVIDVFSTFGDIDVHTDPSGNPAAGPEGCEQPT